MSARVLFYFGVSNGWLWCGCRAQLVPVWAVDRVGFVFECASCWATWSLLPDPALHKALGVAWRRGA